MGMAQRWGWCRTDELRGDPSPEQTLSGGQRDTASDVVSETRLQR